MCGYVHGCIVYACVCMSCVYVSVCVYPCVHMYYVHLCMCMHECFDWVHACMNALIGFMHVYVCHVTVCAFACACMSACVWVGVYVLELKQYLIRYKYSNTKSMFVHGLGTMYHIPCLYSNHIDKH